MMLCGKQPFYEENITKLVQKITSSSPDMKEDGLIDEVSNNAINIILMMLEKNPNLRPSATECLNHQWFKESENKSSSENSGPLS